MASSFTRASPYLQQTAKQLATRDSGSWTYPLWAYVVGCIGVACVCAFNGFITAMIEKRAVRKRTEKDLEAGSLEQVPTDGTFPDSMAKGPHMYQDSSTTESGKKANLPNKMKRVFQKFGNGKSHDDDASVTVVDTSAANTTARNSVGSDSKAPEVYREEVMHKDHVDHIAVSRPDASYSNDPDAITDAHGKVVYEKE